MLARSLFAPLAVALMLSAPAIARADDAPEPRLRHDVVPTFEAVRLRLDADKRSYTGSVRVELRVAKVTTSFDLDGDGQHLARVNVLQGGDTLVCTTESGVNGHLEVTAPRPLAPGPAVLEIDFSAFYGTRAVGLYRVAKDGRNYLFTQFESDDARRAIPCWDEPCFKQPWQVTLEVPASHAAVSNTPVASERTQDGWKTIVFARTPPLPSYLVALATGPLEFTPVPGTHVPTRIVTVQGQKRFAAVAAADTPRLLAALERWFGTPYPFAKLDLIAVPDFAYGAMENAGAITFRDDRLLMDPATATVSQRRSMANVNCHELSHMWFGDLVTMSWWDDLWLNESFADWMAAKVTDEVFPELQQGLNDLERIQQVEVGDMQPSTTAIRAHTTSSGAGLQNVGLVYNKGNAMLSMFEQYLGPETFRRGVRAYLAAHAGGNATAADLWRALDAAGGGKVSQAMATFTDQPGLPLVRVTPVPGGVQLSQSRLTPWGVEQPALTWRIPVRLRWSDGRSTSTRTVMLAGRTLFVPIAGTNSLAWITANAGGHGYYAWSAPGPMMTRLAREAATALAPAERVEFLGDLDLLVAAGEIHGDTYLEALGHFGADPSPQVVASAMQQLTNVRMNLVPDSLVLPFGAYVRRMLDPELGRIGRERRAGEDETIGAMRGDLIGWLAREGGEAQIEAFARERARQYLADSTSVDPGIVDQALSLAAWHGDAALFETYRQRFEASHVPAVRRQFLGALGAFEDPDLAMKALDYSLGNRVQASETVQMWMATGGRSEAHRQRFFDWLTQHYDAVAAHVPPPVLRFLPMTGAGCSQERFEAARAFFTDPKRAVPGVEQTLEQVSDEVRECRSLRDREGASVKKYLEAIAAK